MGKLIDITGCQFGRWTVIARALPQGKGREQARARWLCKCSCGTERVLSGSSLRTEQTLSCGCLKAEKASERKNEHGHDKRGKRSPTYHSWSSMKTRCNNPNRSQWKDYGGAGISYCQEWDTFAKFLEDMGERPSGTSLDRINPYGNYEPSNCRWATPQEQNLNTRKHHDSMRIGEFAVG